MIYLTNLNLSKNELQNAVFQNLTTAPENPKVGQFYFDNNDSVKAFKFWNGTKWVAQSASSVQSVTATDASVVVDNTDAANPKVKANYSATQGTGVTLSTESDGIKVNVQDGTTSQKGIVQLSSTYSKTDETLALTPKGGHVVLKVGSSTTAGALKTYELYQGGEETTDLIGKIDIPKDFLVKGGKLSEASNYAAGVAYKQRDVIKYDTTWYVVKADISAGDNTQFSDVSTEAVSDTFTIGDKVIVLEINVKEGTAESSFILINVKNLIDIYTGSHGVKVENNVISIDNTTTARTVSAVYPVKISDAGLIQDSDTAVKLTHKNSVTLATGSTTVDYTLGTGETVLSCYAVDADGQRVILDITETSTKVTFTIAQAVSYDITCYVVVHSTALNNA